MRTKGFISLGLAVVMLLTSIPTSTVFAESLPEPEVYDESIDTFNALNAEQPSMTARSYSELPAKTAIYSTIGDPNSAFEGNAIGTLGNGNDILYMVNNLNVKLTNLQNDNARFDLVFDGARFLYGKAQLRNSNQRDHSSFNNNFAAGYTATSELINNEYTTLTYSPSSKDLFNITVDGSVLHVAVTEDGIAQSNTTNGLVIPISGYIPGTEETAVTLSVNNLDSPANPITTMPLFSDQLMDQGAPIPINVLISPEDYPNWSLPVPVQKTPLMGWASWNFFGLNISEEKIKGQIDAFVKTPLYEAGYRYVNIDDGYQKGRDELSGLINYDTTKFPKGMKEIADYAHKNGLLAGMYSDAGDNTCGSGADNAVKGNYGYNVGFYNNYENMPNDARDSNVFMHDWGYNFVKVDWCGGGHVNSGREQERYTSIGSEVHKIGAEDGDYKVFNICRWAFPGTWAPEVADSWRTSGDITATWSSVLSCLDTVKPLKQYVGPGHINDPDMLEVGNGNLTYDQNKSHFSMWCMVAAPLALGNDLRTISAETLSIVTNKELIAIDQDPAVIQAEVIKEYRSDSALNGEVWVKDLGRKDSNTKAVALFNRNSTEPLTMSVDFAKDLGFTGTVVARDLWLHQDIPVGSSYTATIPPSGIVVLKLTTDQNGIITGDILDTKLSEAEVSSSYDVELTTPGTSFEYTLPSGLGPGIKMINKWSQYNPSSTKPTDQNEITTQLAPGDIWESNTADAANLYYIDPPAGDNWEAVVQVTSDFTANYPSVGLIAWVDKDNYVSLLRRYHSGLISSGRCFNMVSETNRSGNESGAKSDSDLGLTTEQANAAFIKLVRNGDNFTGYVSADGNTWTLVSSKTNATVAGNESMKIGLFSNGPSNYSVKYNNFKLNNELIPFASIDNLMVKTYVAVSDAKVKVEAISGNKSNAQYIDSREAKKEVAFDTQLFNTQTTPLKIKVTLEEAYSENGEALLWEPSITANADPIGTDEFFFASNHATTGTTVNLDKTGKLDWVVYGSNHKPGSDFLGNVSTSVNAQISEVTANVNYTVNDVSMPVGLAQNGSGSFYEVVLPVSEGLKKADIYFGIKMAEAAVTVIKGDQSYSYNIYDMNDGQGSVVSVWYAGSTPVRVILTITTAFSTDAELRLDASAISNENYLFDPSISYGGDNIVLTTNVANYSSSISNAKLIAACYNNDNKLATFDGAEIIIPSDNEIHTQSSIISKGPSSFDTLKFFLWDNQYIPMVDSVDFELPVPAASYSKPLEQSYYGTLSAKEDVKNGAFLIDVGTPEEYSDMHITWDGGEAINVPLADLLSGIAGIPGINSSDKIILYSGTSYRSVIASRILDYAGYTNIHVLGSMSNWYLDVNIMMPPSIQNRYANNPIIIRYENVSLYDSGSYRLYYSLGSDSTVEDAVEYPDGGINLTDSNTVKAYLKYDGHVVAEAQESYNVYIAKPIPSIPANYQYISDINPWIANVSGWGTTKRDSSIDGRPLTLSGNIFTKGIGTHAPAHIDVAIPDNANRFIAVAGIDDEIGLGRGNAIIFRVLIDGVLIDETPEILQGQYKVFEVDLVKLGYSGSGHVLRLECDQTTDGMDYDHADWCMAGFELN